MSPSPSVMLRLHSNYFSHICFRCASCCNFEIKLKLSNFASSRLKWNKFLFQFYLSRAEELIGSFMSHAYVNCCLQYKNSWRWV